MQIISLFPQGCVTIFRSACQVGKMKRVRRKTAVLEADFTPDIHDQISTRFHG